MLLEEERDFLYLSSDSTYLWWTSQKWTLLTISLEQEIKPPLVFVPLGSHAHSIWILIPLALLSFLLWAWASSFSLDLQPGVAPGCCLWVSLISMHCRSCPAFQPIGAFPASELDACFLFSLFCKNCTLCLLGSFLVRWVLSHCPRISLFSRCFQWQVWPASIHC